MSKCEWRNLKKVSLWNNWITDYSIDILQTTNWLSVNQIDLCKNDLIEGSSMMSHLGTVNLSKLRINEIFINYRLRNTLPKIMI